MNIKKNLKSFSGIRIKKRPQSKSQLPIKIVLEPTKNRSSIRYFLFVPF